MLAGGVGAAPHPVPMGCLSLYSAGVWFIGSAGSVALHADSLFFLGLVLVAASAACGARVGAVAGAVDRPQVGGVVGAASGEVEDVVHLVGLVVAADMAR